MLQYEEKVISKPPFKFPNLIGTEQTKLQHCEYQIVSSETGGFMFKIGYRFASNYIRYCFVGMLGFLNRKRQTMHSQTKACSILYNCQFTLYTVKFPKNYVKIGHSRGKKLEI